MTLLILMISGHWLFGQSHVYFLSATTGAACQQVEYLERAGNKYLFAGTGTTFRVYDANPQLPPYPMLFEYRFRSFITDIQEYNGFLFIASNHDGVSKWNIATPSNPFMIWQYLPETLEEASHDLSFYKDSVIIASNKKVVMLHDQGTAFERVTEWGSAPGLGFISGGAVKGSLYAYTLGRTTSNDGVYLFNLTSMQQVAFYPQTFSDPENVTFGQSTPYLHVMGGTQNYSNPMDSRGLFYTLDLSDPTAPELVFADTVTGFIGLAIANVRFGINLNDTIYVVTTAGLGPDWTFPEPAYGQIYVYDATGLQIKYLTELYAGLWHFDITIRKPRVFIASEWYGIKTIDISNLHDEQDLGNTLTGGWAMKSDVHENRLAIANEGYGFKLYEISNPLSPELILVNNDPGFCSNVKFSPDGSYIYAQYQTYTPFRIYHAATLEKLGELEIPGYASNYGFSRMLAYGERVFLDHLDGPAQRLRIIDVSDPSDPQLEAEPDMDARDMELDDQGRLFICNDDSILVYDVTENKLARLAGQALDGIQNGLKLAVYRDTLFVFVSSKGLTRYILVDNGSSWSLDEDVSIFLSQGVPQELAADSLGLYLGYTQFGINIRNKKKMVETANYRTGLDYKGFTNVWPLTDLFCRNGYVYVTEYFGQTSILTADPVLNGVKDKIVEGKSMITIYPNPNRGNFWVDIKESCLTGKEGEIIMYGVNGQVVYQRSMILQDIIPRAIRIDHSLPAGIYLLKVGCDDFSKTFFGKIVVY